LQVYAELTRGTTWSCEWSGVDAAVGAEPTVVDGHAHSLVIQCRVPAAVLSAVRHDGRFESTVKLVTSKLSKNGGTGTAVVFALSDVPVCGSPIAARDQVVDLAACTMVSEIDPRFNPAVLTRQWVDCKFSLSLHCHVGRRSLACWPIGNGGWSSVLTKLTPTVTIVLEPNDAIPHTIST
jgi:hypothetical protein